MNQKTIWNNKLIRICLVFIGVWFFFQFLFTLIAPFVLAFLLITLCYPLLQRIQKKIPIRKKFLAVGIILPLLLLVMGILWVVMILGGRQLDGLPAFCTQVGEKLQMFFHQCCCGLDGRFGWDGQQIEQFVIERMTVIMENVQIQVVPQILSSSYSCFKGIFSTIGFLAITCIAAFLLEKEYAGIVENLKKSEELRLVWAVVEGVLSYIITFMKAQGVILLIISVLCSVVLSVAGVPGGIMFGILAGVLDVLPFIGTGIVLAPLSVWQLLNGQYMRMAVCLILYGVCILTRELLEPKLIGRRIGVAPVFMLLAVYAGVKLFGIGGIIKGPLALIVIVEILKIMKKDQGEFDERESFPV
ncbi:MAG: AI-2E family transporter [Lachnospiraceae bacterium]|nr:AI-2E family transporter [Lachnospiraceae bacterium]